MIHISLVLIVLWFHLGTGSRVYAQTPVLPQKVVGITEYPSLAALGRLEGTVDLRCEVDEHGNVVAVTPIESDGSKRSSRILEIAAELNASKWRFSESPGANPTRRTFFQLTYTFTLKPGTRGVVPPTEFVFEYPNKVIVTSQWRCSEHLPCTEEEQKNWKSSLLP